MGTPLSNLLLALTFFTRLPLPIKLGEKIDHDASLTEATAFFPIIGLVIGVLTGLVWYVAALALPNIVAAGLAIAAGVLITGALHEDGLADCADGLGGSADREKSLEIMRDSRIGTYGGIALIITVGLRWGSLAALTPIGGASALIIAHTVSRSAMILAMKWSQYARPEGLGKLASGEISNTDVYISFLISLVLVGVFGGVSGLIAALLALGLSWLFLLYLEKRLGGYTGDGLGAMQQIAEITILITLAGAWA
ncbi:MAG: adenosylcobinamide-GDP ribazoletransferase [Rhizobiaceae bacterium]|nr:adenosylcobinamide-GDP ribazoletransferase [Rhizobiaceae bacterium]